LDQAAPEYNSVGRLIDEVMPSSQQADPAEAHYDLKDPAGLAGCLIDSDIKLIRAEYLRTLLDTNGRFPRRQEAENMTFIDPSGASRSALVSHEEVEAWVNGSKDAIICSVSHAWEAREHIDPCGHQLQQLVHHISLYVAAFMAEIWVFVDYTSLYQYLRKPEEDRSFKLAMGNMHCMYAHECTITFRIEKLTPEDVFEKAIRDNERVTIFDATSNTVKPVLIENLIRNTTSYDERGWCIAEIEWSSDRASTGQHQVIDIVGTRDALALKARVPTAPEDFGMNMKMAKFTHRSDEVQVISLQEKIFLEKVTRNETLSLEGLPRNELRALAQALPFFEVLQAIKLVGFDCGKEEAEEFVKALQKTKVTKFACRNKSALAYKEGLNHVIEALCLSLHSTSIVELTVSRNDHISDASMSLATLKVMAEALKDSKVTHLTLERLQKNEGFKVLVEALKCSKVTHLSFAGTDFGHDSSEDLKVLAELLMTSTFTHVNLSGCHINVEGIKALVAALKSNETVVDINLASNYLGDKGAEVIADFLNVNPTIRCLNLETCLIKDAGVEALASALRSNTVLTKLKLYGNDVGPKGAQALADALMVNNNIGTDWKEAEISNTSRSRHPFGAPARLQALADALRLNQTIRELHLQRNRMGDEGLKALAHALRINQTIALLILDHNQIGDEGVKALADAVRINQTVTKLYLGDNQIGDEGLKALADAFRINQTVAVLNLSNNQIGDEGLKALADALCINHTVRELHFQRNQIADEGFKAVADAVCINQTIAELYLGDNQNGDQGIKALAAALEVNKTVKQVGLSDANLNDEGRQALERIRAICKRNRAEKAALAE